MKRGRKLFGFEHSTVVLNGSPYLERWIMYLGPICLRLHKFFRGDDDRAPHDHPFWFVTMPLGSGYYERIYGESSPAVDELLRRLDNVPPGVWIPRLRYVRPWRFHYRPARFKHIVIGRHQLPADTRPFWTFVIAGFVQPNWGYWPTPDTFIPWQTWGNNYDPSN